MDTKDLVAYGLDGVNLSTEKVGANLMSLGEVIKEDVSKRFLDPDNFDKNKEWYEHYIGELKFELAMLEKDLEGLSRFQDMYSSRGKTVQPVDKIDTEKLFKIRDLGTGKIYRLVKYNLKRACTYDVDIFTPHEYYGTMVDISFLDEDNTEFNISYTTCDGKKAKFELLDVNENRLGDI